MTADLVVASVVAVAIALGGISAAWYAICTGLAFDLLSLRPAGVGALSLCAVALLVLWVRPTLRGIGIWVVPVVGIAGSFLSGLFYLIGLALVGEEAFFSIDSLTTLAWRSLYDGMLTLPVLLVVMAVLGRNERHVPIGSKPL
ncbi:MAG: hypothetical protein KDB86_11110 [Actinobacteria bacterium]|nr:hypothetical protein [Actinomycetota bacterium]MCB9389049.1 hypothetical protein [Acidimicrobiia bacterium]